MSTPSSVSTAGLRAPPSPRTPPDTRSSPRREVPLSVGPGGPRGALRAPATRPPTRSYAPTRIAALLSCPTLRTSDEQHREDESMTTPRADWIPRDNPSEDY